jgi:hypothetical protein
MHDKVMKSTFLALSKQLETLCTPFPMRLPCAERDQLQERLRTLRGSLGSGHAAEARDLIDLQQEAADFDTAPALDGPGPPGFAGPRLPAPGQGPLDHAAGMFALLRHHVKALTRAQEQLGALLQQQHQDQAQGLAEGEHASAGPMLAQVAHAAAMLAAELPAMQATIQVLSTEVTYMLQEQHKLEGKRALWLLPQGALQTQVMSICDPASPEIA